MAQEVQQLILDLLEKSNEIKDTRTIVLPGESASATSQESQLLIQGALNSLLSREVLPYALLFLAFLCNTCSTTLINRFIFEPQLSCVITGLYRRFLTTPLSRPASVIHFNPSRGSTWTTHFRRVTSAIDSSRRCRTQND